MTLALSIIGWVGWIAAGLVGLFVVVSAILWGGMKMGSAPEGAVVELSAPSITKVNEHFDLVVLVINQLDRERPLGHIDIDKTYLDGIVVESVTPQPEESSVFRTSFDYIMGVPVPPRDSLEVRFRCRAVKAGDFTGEALIYVDGGSMRWVTRSIRTVVTA